METKPNPYYCLRILSYDPLITLSGCQTDDIYIKLMAEDLPEIFDKKPGLHLLLPTNNLEDIRARQIKNSIKTASEKMPGHAFVVVSNTEFETFLMSNEGVPTLQAHQAIFQDERTWCLPERRYETLGTFDAVYNARLDKQKRHELASRIKSLLLIYAYSIDERVESSTNRMRDILPHAYFSNHELKGTRNYSDFTPAEIVTLFGHSHVGLILSREEGYSRTSTEYLMCGLPVVSTKSIGGRDRYYFGKYCRIVEDNERAVDDAVYQLKEMRFSRQEVRDHLLQMLNFDRANFIRNVNRVVEHTLGKRDFFDSILPFLGIKQKFIQHTDILNNLKLEQMDRHKPPANVR